MSKITLRNDARVFKRALKSSITLYTNQLINPFICQNLKKLSFVKIALMKILCYAQSQKKTT